MHEHPGTFAIAFVEGVTLARWTRAWEERQRRIRLTFLPTVAADQLDALQSGEADVAFVRLPVDRDGLSVIALYDEAPVVVLGKEHALADADSVTLADLEGEDRVSAELPTADAVALVSVGGGILLLPQSVARLHARKDVEVRPVKDAAETGIALAWVAERTTPEIEEFVGIVRGRTANSSRSAAQPAAAPAPARQTRPAKTPRKPAPRSRRPRQGR